MVIKSRRKRKHVYIIGPRKAGGEKIKGTASSNGKKERGKIHSSQESWGNVTCYNCQRK